MRLAEQVAKFHESDGFLNDFKKALKKNTKQGNIHDVLSDSDVSYFWGEVDDDGDMDLGKWDANLEIKDFSQVCIDLIGDNLFSSEEVKPLCSKIPDIIKGENFSISGYTGDLVKSDGDTEEYPLKRFIVRITSSKYDVKKDVLTADCSVETAEI